MPLSRPIQTALSTALLAASGLYRIPLRQQSVPGHPSLHRQLDHSGSGRLGEHLAQDFQHIYFRDDPDEFVVARVGNRQAADTIGNQALDGGSEIRVR